MSESASLRHSPRTGCDTPDHKTRQTLYSAETTDCTTVWGNKCTRSLKKPPTARCDFPNDSYNRSVATSGPPQPHGTAAILYRRLQLRLRTLRVDPEDGTEHQTVPSITMQQSRRRCRIRSVAAVCLRNARLSMANFAAACESSRCAAAICLFRRLRIASTSRRWALTRLDSELPAVRTTVPHEIAARKRCP